MLFPHRPQDTSDNDSGQRMAVKDLERSAHLLQAVQCLYVSLRKTSRPQL